MHLGILSPFAKRLKHVFMSELKNYSAWIRHIADAGLVSRKAAEADIVATARWSRRINTGVIIAVIAMFIGLGFVLAGQFGFAQFNKPVVFTGAGIILVGYVMSAATFLLNPRPKPSFDDDY